MILYHGSTMEVSQPRILKSEIGRDFGFAFYTTDIQAQAERWARRRAMIESRRTKTEIQAIVSVYEWDDIGLYVQLSSPSSCSARKKPRTSSSTLPAGCGREIVCGWELLCSSVWRIVFKSRRNCSRCACWHSARQSQFVRCPAGMADRISHACRCSGLSRNSVVPKRAVCGLSCMACYLRCQPLVCLRV